MKNLTQFRGARPAARWIGACLLLSACATTAGADTLKQLGAKIKPARQTSQMAQDDPDLPPKVKEQVQAGEQKSIDAAYAAFEKQGNRLVYIGQPTLDGSAPIATLGLGTTGLLQFQFIDPITGLPTAGPTIGSVSYSVNLDPGTDIFVPVGTSFDAASNFSLSFTVSGFEPLILATPFDLSGAPIVNTGPGGDNDATGLVVDLFVTVPEPATFALACPAAVCLVGYVWHRRRQALRRSLPRGHPLN